MKGLLFSVMVGVMVVAGCLPFEPTPANEPPTAYIDSVSSAKISPGERVTLAGHGADPDGSIAAYSWRSSIEGQLGNSADLETSSLSEGTHTIWFRVQDSNGEWSKEVSCHVTVLPSGFVPPPVIESFEASPGSIASGESSTLSWDVSGVATVTIDPGIGNVALTGTRAVSPTEATGYTLTASNESASVTATAEITVATVPTHTVELFSIAAEDGHVRKDEYVGSQPEVGDTTPVRTDVAMQAFLSFDISMIPEGVTVESGSLDITTYDVFGQPFPYLGRMSVYNDQYGHLDSDDFVVGPGANALYTASGAPTEPFTSDLLAEAVQARLDAGSRRFQVRVQFEKYTRFNQAPDYLRWGEGEAKLVVEYQD